MASPTPKQVVILGGGFAGLYAARALARADVNVTVIDRHNHHLFQPMLYQVATAALSPSDIAGPIRSILRRQRNTTVVLGEAERVDIQARNVHLFDGGSYHYDYLIVATGARHSYFGHDDWEQRAPGLKSLEDAEEIRRRILMAFEAAEREPDPLRRQALLTFVVVGGGPTGVEVAGALAEIRNFALLRDFRHIDPRDASVVLVEGGPRILPSYPPHLSEKAKLALRRLDVAVHEQTMVTEIRDESVAAGGWTIPTHTVVWAAGNIASPMLATLGAPQDRQGRVVVAPDCTIPGHSEVFVLGDAAAFDHHGEGPVPGVCPAAIQMGKHAARAIKEDLRGIPRTPFHYHDKGQLAVIGRGRAVADLKSIKFGGFFAWLAWIFVHIFFLIGFRNRVLVLFEWAWSYVTYGRGARIITGTFPDDLPSRPPVDLVTDLSARVTGEAQRLGFLACGVTPLGPNQHADALDRWLKAGLGGTMTYLNRQAKKRKNTRLADAQAKVAVVVLDRYHSDTDRPTAGPPDRPRIARYARGHDYHDVIGDRLEALAAFLKSLGATHTRAYVDTGPVPERELARMAGLGWIGKNTMLIRPGVGSWFFIGVVLTDLDLPADSPFTADHCGTCTRCLDACPTGAFVEERVLDATKCISYQTIEWKKEIPVEVAAHADGWAFGCDICNEVCPWNERFAGGPVHPDLVDHQWIPSNAPRDYFDRMTENEFHHQFDHTPLERTGLTRMRRNWAMAWGSLDQ